MWLNKCGMLRQERQRRVGNPGPTVRRFGFKRASWFCHGGAWSVCLKPRSVHRLLFPPGLITGVCRGRITIQAPTTHSSLHHAGATLSLIPTRYTSASSSCRFAISLERTGGQSRIRENRCGIEESSMLPQGYASFFTEADHPACPVFSPRAALKDLFFRRNVP